jgi:hypothetical protein
VNSRRCNLRKEEHNIPDNPAGVDHCCLYDPSGVVPRVVWLSSVGCTYGYSKCCPPGNSAHPGLAAWATIYRPFRAPNGMRACMGMTSAQRTMPLRRALATASDLE